MKANPHYIAISEHYGDKRAKRSQVPLMNHIDEGIIILDVIGASIEAKEAYCLHPIYQIESFPEKVTDESKLRRDSINLAIEYKRVANAYLSPHYVSDDDVIELSPIDSVNHMLIADKIQNRKDFELYHKGTHPKSDVLDGYFKNWLKRLGVSEDEYQQIAGYIRKVK